MINKSIKPALLLLGLVSVVLWFSLPSTEDPEAIDSNIVHTMFIILYLLLGIALLTTLVFGLRKLLSSPGSLKKNSFVLGIFAIVVAISYGLSTNNEAVVTTMAERGVETTENTVKLIGMGVNIFFILALLAIALMILPGIKRMLVK